MTTLKGKLMELIDQLWEALKENCCKSDPTKVKTIVFLNEEKFRKAVQPILAPTEQDKQEAFRRFLDECSAEVATWEPWERNLLNG